MKEIALERLRGDEEVDRPERDRSEQAEKDPEEHEHFVRSLYQNTRGSSIAGVSEGGQGAASAAGGREAGAAPHILAMEAASSPESSSDSSSMPRSLAVPS